MYQKIGLVALCTLAVVGGQAIADNSPTLEQLPTTLKKQRINSPTTMLVLSDLRPAGGIPGVRAEKLTASLYQALVDESDGKTVVRRPEHKFRGDVYTLEGDISCEGAGDQTGPYLVTLRVYMGGKEQRKIVVQLAGTAKKGVDLENNFSGNRLVHGQGLVGELARRIAASVWKPDVDLNELADRLASASRSAPARPTYDSPVRLVRYGEGHIGVASRAAIPLQAILVDFSREQRVAQFQTVTVLPGETTLPVTMGDGDAGALYLVFPSGGRSGSSGTGIVPSQDQTFAEDPSLPVTVIGTVVQDGQLAKKVIAALNKDDPLVLQIESVQIKQLGAK